MQHIKLYGIQLNNAYRKIYKFKYLYYEKKRSNINNLCSLLRNLEKEEHFFFKVKIREQWKWKQMDSTEKSMKQESDSLKLLMKLIKL